MVHETVISMVRTKIVISSYAHFLIYHTGNLNGDKYQLNRTQTFQN